MPEHLTPVCYALQNPAVVKFVRTCLNAGYREIFTLQTQQVNAMIEYTIEQLCASQSESVDPQRLIATTVGLLHTTFHKDDHNFWFNRIYHDYKTRIKPAKDIDILCDLIAGDRLLDFGCGSGYLSARLSEEGFHVFTTDVLDYRYPEALHLPFARMSSPEAIPYAIDSIDTALVQAVLHHIDPLVLPLVLQNLARIARRVVIKEDTFNLPPELPQLPSILARQPLLRDFVSLSLEDQVQVLVLIDYFSNAIAQGIPEMQMPFAFKSVHEWGLMLQSNGLEVIQTLVTGFEPGRMHKSCHIWLVCERAHTKRYDWSSSPQPCSKRQNEPQ